MSSRYTLNKICAFVIFLISPILYFPMMLRDIRLNRRYAYVLLCLFFAFLSYLFIPVEGWDRLYYLHIYENSKDGSLFNLFVFISTGPYSSLDYILQSYMFLCANLHIPFRVAVAVVSFITIYNFLYFIRNILTYHQVSPKYFIWVIFLFLITIRIGFFSGIRFYLAFSFLYIALYKDIFEQKKIKSLLFLLLAISTHSGLLMFIPIFLMTKIIRKFKNFYLVIIASYAFLLIPPVTIFYLLSGFLSGAYFAKLESYFLNQEGFNDVIVTSRGALISYIFMLIWVNVYILYLLYTGHRKSILRNIIYSIVPFANIFFQTPAVYERFLIVLIVLCILNMIVEYLKHNDLQIMKIIIPLIFISTLGEISFTLPTIKASYLNERGLLAPTIFFSEIPDYIKQ